MIRESEKAPAGRRAAPRPSADAIARVRAVLDQQGKTVADWARENGESSDTVHKVLSGRRACTSGAQHRVAVKLGLKPDFLAAAPSEEAA